MCTTWETHVQKCATSTNFSTCPAQFCSLSHNACFSSPTINAFFVHHCTMWTRASKSNDFQRAGRKFCTRWKEVRQWECQINLDHDHWGCSGFWQGLVLVDGFPCDQGSCIWSWRRQCFWDCEWWWCHVNREIWWCRSDLVSSQTIHLNIYQYSPEYIFSPDNWPQWRIWQVHSVLMQMAVTEKSSRREDPD